MRLLLDEHYSPGIARQLRERGYDVVAVAERADLAGLSDRGLAARMVAERRAVMTNNVKDFVPLAGQAALDGDDHYGLLLTSDRSMPRHRDAIGRYVEALVEFLDRHPGEDGCRNRVVWLPRPQPRQDS